MVHEQELMGKIQLPKGKVIALKASQKTKTKHQCKAFNSVERLMLRIVMMIFLKKMKKN